MTTVPTVTRQSTRKKRPASAYEISVSEESDHELPHPPPKRSKTKATLKESGSKTVRRGKTGKLSKLPDMPLDVLFEIFAFLHPLDLLHLARTTKSLRAVLIHRSARCVWTDCFASVEGMPKCPDDLSEPQYARLAFDPLCQNCCKSRATEVIWVWYGRYCKQCLRNVDLSFTCSPIEVRANRSLSQLLDKSMLSYCDLLPEAIIPQGRQQRSRMRISSRVLTCDVQRLVQQIECEATAGNDLEQLIEVCAASTKKRYQFAELYEDWQTTQTKARDEDREEARRSRKDAVLAKLVDLGWGEELEKYPQSYIGLDQHPQVKQPKALSERSWTHMKPSILAFMEARKEERQRAHLINRRKSRFIAIQDVVKQFKRSRHPKDFSPRAEDVYSLSDVKDIVINGTDEEFQTFHGALLSQLPELGNRCLEKCYEVLHSIIPSRNETSSADAVETSAPSESHDSIPPHELATSWYECKNYCSDLFNHRDIMMHSHFFPTAHFGHHGVEIREFSGDSIEYSVTSVDLATKVVLACGKNPKVTTVDDMDRLQPRFALLQPNRIEVVTWQYLIRSMQSRYRGLVKWRLLNDNELPEYVHVGAFDSEPSWSCVHCKKEGGSSPWNSDNVSLNQVLEHIVKQHNIMNVTESDYYTMDRPTYFRNRID